MIAVFSDNSNEINVLMNKLEIINERKFGNIKVFEAILNCKKIIIVDSGCAKVNVGAAAGTIFNEYDIDLVIGIGNCGCLNREFGNIGDLAISIKSLQFDADFSKIGYPIPSIPSVNESIFLCDEYLISLARNIAFEMGFAAIESSYGTSDTFVANNMLANEVNCKFNVQCVDNECGAMGEMAYQYKIPYVYVKGISNFADDNAPQMYYENRDIANSNACDVVYNMLNQLTSCCDYKYKSNEKICENEYMSSNIKISEFEELNYCQMLNVIEKSKYTILAVSENNIPYMIPMSFKFINECNKLLFYLYSKPFCRKMRCIENNEIVGLNFEMKTCDGILSVFVSGIANIVYENFEVMCDNDLILIKIEVDKITGRKYFYCK